MLDFGYRVVESCLVGKVDLTSKSSSWMGKEDERMNQIQSQSKGKNN